MQEISERCMFSGGSVQLNFAKEICVKLPLSLWNVLVNKSGRHFFEIYNILLNREKFVIQAAAIKCALKKVSTSINNVSPDFELCRPRASKCLKSAENGFLESLRTQYTLMRFTMVRVAELGV
ncbi:uncharacterized protein EAF02_003724 [Botrytis sinoallii]|uniref:uncharacterized protein n=1 Tax=Botrytis sinoallii TaxID=1463999 RepID=UPI0018FF5C72|nr:uncharacterized protein EAF02_003724 [Botrytis sinoallii]KAF7887077.1 hypothetical protein EAF02_003724 [Botrytis sinoallii]